MPGLGIGSGASCPHCEALSRPALAGPEPHVPHCLPGQRHFGSSLTSGHYTARIKVCRTLYSTSATSRLRTVLCSHGSNMDAILINNDGGADVCSHGSNMDTILINNDGGADIMFSWLELHQNLY